MDKWKTVLVKQDLVDQIEKEVDKSKYESLSDFVSKAINHRLQTTRENRILQHLKQTHVVGLREYTCINSSVHKVKVARYDDSSIWVMCPKFGWFEDCVSGVEKLGCKDRKKRCTWFVG